MPKTDKGWVRFITIGNDLIVGFKEAEDGGDDNMKRDNDMISLYGSPLKVVFRPYLDGRGECEREGDDGLVVSKME